MAPGANISPTAKRSEPDEEYRFNSWCSKVGAIVGRWNHEKVIVLCPFCDDTHEHFFTSGFLALHTTTPAHKEDGVARLRLRIIRRAPCSVDMRHGRRLFYKILFPHYSDKRVSGLGWEKVLACDDTNGFFGGFRGGFRTVGLRPDLVQRLRVHQTRHKDEVQVDRITSLLEATHIEHSSDKTSQSEGDEERKPVVCPFGCSDGTAHPVRDTQGCSLLAHLIAQGRYAEAQSTVRLEIVEVDSCDARGRTPLMEAALWGQVNTVVSLLEAGADPLLGDWEDRTAADYASESARNDRERSERHVSYSEDPYVKKADRAQVRTFLVSQTFVDNRTTWHLDDSASLFFYKSPEDSKISFFAPGNGSHIANQGKTAAILSRGDQFPLIFAVSGWSTKYLDIPCQAGLERLNPVFWTHRTMKIAKETGFEFPTESGDQGNPGSFCASHAEAKLVSYYFDRYWASKVDETGLPVDEKFAEMCRNLRPRPEGRIDISQNPCMSCQRWLKHIVNITGFSLEYRLAVEVNMKQER